jgi:2-aminoadipate transaminase
MTTNSRPQLADLFAARARNVPPPLYDLSQDSSLISFVYGYADPALFPGPDLLAAAAAILDDDIDGALNYGHPDPQLRELVAGRLRRRGVEADPAQVLIGYGSSQLLGLVSQAMIDPGDVIVIEGPSFLGAVRLFTNAGARVVTVPVDQGGLDTGALEQALRDLAGRGVRPKFIYTIPTFQNPTGATLTLERRRRLVALAAEHGVLVIDDDAYGDLRFEGAPLPPLAALDERGWVLTLGTFSKILAPGLRLGWAWGHPEVVGRLEMLKLEGATSPLTTRLVTRFARGGRLDAHIQRLCAHYRHKRDVALAAAQAHFPAGVRALRPEGGFFLWCDLPEGLDGDALLKRARDHGVAFLPGTRCFADGQGQRSIRLAFSYLPEEQIGEGIARLGRAMAES